MHVDERFDCLGAASDDLKYWTNPNAVAVSRTDPRFVGRPYLANIDNRYPQRCVPLSSHGG